MHSIYTWIKNVWWDRISLASSSIDLKVKYRGGGWSVLTELLVGWLETAEFYAMVHCIMGMITAEGDVFSLFLNIALKYTDELKIKQIVVIIDVN